jgi:hypothetical protein
LCCCICLILFWRFFLIIVTSRYSSGFLLLEFLCRMILKCRSQYQFLVNKAVLFFSVVCV